MFALRFPIPIDLAIFCVGLRFLEKGIAPVRQIEVDGVLPLAGGIMVMLVTGQAVRRMMTRKSR